MSPSICEDEEAGNGEEGGGHEELGMGAKMGDSNNQEYVSLCLYIILLVSEII